jgi:hypothetical protein
VIIIVGKFIQSKFEFIEGSMNYIEKLTWKLTTFKAIHTSFI